MPGYIFTQTGEISPTRASLYPNRVEGLKFLFHSQRFQFPKTVSLKKEHVYHYFLQFADVDQVETKITPARRVVYHTSSPSQPKRKLFPFK